MKHLKQLFTVMLLLCCSIAVANTIEVDGVYYNVTDTENKTLEVTRGVNKYTGSVVIPKSVTYNGTTYSVTGIGDAAFRFCSGLTSVEIPNSVTSIEQSAFSYCSGLASIVVEEGNSKYDSRDNCNAIIETASNKLIAGCKNTVIPNSVTSIGSFAFEYCNDLTNIIIPNSVTSIESVAFFSCSGLTSVTIGNCVTSIGESAFSYCSGLASIVVEEGNSKYDSGDNCNAIIDTESNMLIIGCKNTIIPNSVTSIGGSAFYGCTTLTNIKIPNSVTNIGNDAFYDCTDLTTITIPNSVKSIGNRAFAGCQRLANIKIPNSITSIGQKAFNGTKWYDNQPDGVVYAGKVLYQYKSIMPENTSIVIKDGTIGVADGAFEFCTGLTSIEIPNSVISIGQRAFNRCSGLTRIDIVDGVKRIGTSAFAACSKLQEVYISNTIESIDNYAFNACNNILEIKVGSKDALTASENIFSEDTYNNAILFVPQRCKFAYERATPWSKFKIQEMDFTCISDLQGENCNVKTIYDLHGRVVKNPISNIYIIDGKKVFIK